MPTGEEIRVCTVEKRDLTKGMSNDMVGWLVKVHHRFQAHHHGLLYRGFHLDPQP